MKPRETGIGRPSSSLAQVHTPFCEESDSLLEKMLERENLLLALRRVEANKGAPGVDGVTVAQLRLYIQTHWADIRQQLLAGTYKPQPVRGRNSETRRRDAGTGDIQQGYRLAVDLDLAKFFDRGNHDKAMARVARKVKDKRVLKLIRAFLNAGTMADGVVIRNEEGTPQGGPLSPLLANIMLDDFDKELEKRGHRSVCGRLQCQREVAQGGRASDGVTDQIPGGDT